VTEGQKSDRRLATLMRAAQRGDTAAYVELLQSITPRLRRLVRRHRKFLAVEDIEDLVQDVLLSLHAVRATYDPDRPFIPWLFAITRNRLADGARRHARRAAHEVTVESLPVTFSNNSANISIETFDELENLKSAIEALPRGQRHAIELVKLREMSLKEAATASGISVGALKVAVHRGICALRRNLRKA
jgi:RNA polymerase sigma-70 factor (ECF subfamily)